MANKVIVNGLNIGYIPPSSSEEILYTRGGISIKDKIDDITSKLPYDPAGGKHYTTYSSDIDSLIDTALGTLTTDQEGYFTIDNYATLGINGIGLGNHQYIYGWLNSTKKYGWVMVCSFSAAFYGKRFDASTFTFYSRLDHISADAIPYDSTKSIKSQLDQVYNSVPPRILVNWNYFTISGDSILNKVKTLTNSLSFWYTQNATDSPTKGTISFTIINTASSGGAWTHIYHFSGANIYYANTAQTVPSALTWTKMV